MKPTHLHTARTLRDSVFIQGSTSGPVAKAPGYGGVWWAAITLCAIATAVILAIV